MLSEERVARPVRFIQANEMGFGLAFIGIFAIGIGTLIILMAAGVVPLAGKKNNAPPLLIGAVGGVFAIAGGAIFVGGIRGGLRTSRTERLKAMHPGKPWMYDHPWSADGIAEDGSVSPSSYFLGSAFMAVFLAPFHYIAFVQNVWPFYLVLLFDLILLFIIYEGIVATLRRAKYGTSRLRFRHFPFFVGDKLDAAFCSERPIGEFRSVLITLRALRERREGKSSNAFQIYKNELKIEQAGIAGAQEFPIVLDLPANAPGTDLAAKEPVYWELEIVLDTPGVDYKAQFIVPVYAGHTS